MISEALLALIAAFNSTMFVGVSHLLLVINLDSSSGSAEARSLVNNHRKIETVVLVLWSNLLQDKGGASVKV